MKVYGSLLTIIVFLLGMGTSAAEIYRWVDEDGVVHFSDSPTRDNSEATEQEEISTPDPLAENSAQRPAEDQKATSNPDFFDFLDESKTESVASEKPSVEIYTTSWCGYCEKAKNFFRSKGIDFVEYDIEKDKQAARRMMSLTPTRAVPFVVINGQGVQGYSEQAYELALQN